MARYVRNRDVAKGRELAEWRALYPEAYGFELEWDDEVGVPIPVKRNESRGRCGAKLKGPGHCDNFAGTRTAHEGVGRCWRHDTRVERAAGAWAVAHRIAQVMEISPWEALLGAVRRAAAWAAFYDEKLKEVDNDDDLRPGGDAYHWVEAAERVNEKLARWSKMAVDAGVARLLVERAQADGTAVARVLNEAITGASLDPESEERLRTALRHALLAMGAAGMTPEPITSASRLNTDEPNPDTAS